MTCTPHPYFSGDKIGKKKWAGHVAVRGKERRIQGFGGGKEMGEAWTGLIWLRIGTGGGCVCNEPSGSIKMRGIS